MPLPPELVGNTPSLKQQRLKRRSQLNKKRRIAADGFAPRKYEPVKGVGAPKKIGEAEAQEICKILSEGGSLYDAADALFIDRQTIANMRRESPEFSARVKKAIADNKLGLIGDTQSEITGERDGAKFQLERRHWRDFGRKERYEHSGLPEAAQPAQQTTVIVNNNQSIDYDSLQRLFESNLISSTAVRTDGSRVLETNGHR